jgi:hypothetical protein
MGPISNFPNLRERIREFSADEERRFWAALRSDYHPISWFFLSKGLRKGACVGMTKDRVDLDNLAIRSRARPKEGGGALSPADHRNPGGSSSTRDGLSPCSAVWSYVVQRGRNAAGVHPLQRLGCARRSKRHCMRPELPISESTTSARLCVEAAEAHPQPSSRPEGMDHSDISATVRYAHVLDEDVAQRAPGIGSRQSVK